MARAKNTPQFFTLNERPLSLKEIAHSHGIKYGTLYNRVNKSGYTINSGHALVPTGHLHKWTVVPSGPFLKPLK